MPPKTASLRDAARFDRAAATYDAWAEHHRAIADALFDLPGLPAAPRRILDAGCGTGLTSLRAALRYPAACLIGLDRAPAMIDAYARRFPRAETIVGDLRDAPLPRDIDLIVSSCVFQWLDAYLPTLARLRDVLAPCGTLAFAEPVVGTLPEFAAACERAHLTGLGLPCRPADACLRALDASGFRILTAQLRDFPVNYPSARSALRSFSGIGAVPGKPALSPGLTRRLIAALTQVCNGRITLTYRVLLAVATPNSEPRTRNL